MTATTLLIWEDLTWIQDAVGIESGLHALHQSNLDRRQLEPEIRRFGNADAVLAAD
jgi:hypothetical protein